MSPGADPGAAARALAARGVRCVDPRQVYVDPAVDPARIAPGVVLHPGTRLLGAGTSIGPGCELGAEGSAVVEDCRLGHGVSLKGGFFRGAVFLDGSGMGSAAHVRPGTLLEERAEAAHAVGFKQTILFPFVVTGSLVNLCDALLAGGTGRRDHSEVGSSYVHFNFTPHGDKATPSLIGDVPEGVLLDRPRIFLGGQGGLVGPASIAYGTVIAAGVVRRGDVTEPGRLVGAGRTPGAERAYAPEVRGDMDEIVRRNLRFIGNLFALRAWYDEARRPFMDGDPWRRACLEGAQALLAGAVRERVDRLEAALAAAAPGPWREAWPAQRARIEAGPPPGAGAAARERFLRAWSAAPVADGYLDTVRALDGTARADARAWLKAVVASIDTGEKETP